jgi:phosphoribosyl-ATP pyrophosphohydrolase
MSRAEILDRLFEVVLARKREKPEDSYVAALMAGGIDAIAEKIREESEEVIQAARSGDVEHTAREVADLLFHTWVLMAAVDSEPERTFAALEERFGTSGLAEKASRRKNPEDDK